MPDSSNLGAKFICVGPQSVVVGKEELVVEWSCSFTSGYAKKQMKTDSADISVCRMV